MKKYLAAYLKYIDGLIASGKFNENTIKEHLVQIQFMQHERLIHLIVTVLFTIAMFICIGILAATENIAFALLTCMILILLVPYIMHYYFLENSVQKMYSQYNTMAETSDKFPEECTFKNSSDN